MASDPKMSILAEKLASIIERKIKPKNVTRLGQVKDIDGKTFNVQLDGDDRPIPVRAACEANVGQRVVVLTETTNYLVIAAIKE